MTKKTYVFFSHLEEANILKIFEYQINSSLKIRQA